MVKILFHECKNDLKVGEFVYICDYRFNNIDNQAIRHVKPQKVIICSNEDLPKNKNVYYSDIHFKPVGANGKIRSQIIAPFDNTGYRSYSGVSLNIFYDEGDCIKHYKKQCKEIIEEFEKAKVSKIEHYDRMIENIKVEMNM